MTCKLCSRRNYENISYVVIAESSGSKQIPVSYTTGLNLVPDMVNDVDGQQKLVYTGYCQ